MARKTRAISVLVLALVVAILLFRPYDGYITYFQSLFYLGNDTKYSKNYDEHKFRDIRQGFTQNYVIKNIGEPLYKRVYAPGNRSMQIIYDLKEHGYLDQDQIRDFVSKALEKNKLDSAFGFTEYWWYSESPSDTDYFHRLIKFSYENKKVIEVSHEFYID